MCMYIYEYVYISVFITYDMYAILLFYLIYINKYVIYIIQDVYKQNICIIIYIPYVTYIAHYIIYIISP